MASPARQASCYASAHRGLSSEVTENTVAAFQAAAEAGFRSFELDARLTRDGEVVVLHDASLARTTDVSTRVSDIRYDELRSYATPDGPIPRLDDLLGTMKGWKGVWNLEIKAGQATEPTLRLAEHHGILDRALVSSFDPEHLAAAKDLMPDVPRALINMGGIANEDVAEARRLECSWFNAHHRDLSPANMGRLADAGFNVAAWTVNDPTEALALAELGVHCVITDRRDIRQVLGDPQPFV